VFIRFKKDYRRLLPKEISQRKKGEEYTNRHKRREIKTYFAVGLVSEDDEDDDESREDENWWTKAFSRAAKMHFTSHRHVTTNEI